LRTPLGSRWRLVPALSWWSRWTEL
jgi:hypothetical protein